MRRRGQVLAAPDRALIEPCVNRRRPDDETTQPPTGRAAVPATSSFIRTWSTAPCGGCAAPALCALTNPAAGL